LRIEHPVPDFDAWKDTFDSDPIDRRGSGVRSYRILRAADDPNYVMVDLEFDNSQDAEKVLAALRQIWARVQAEGLIGGPQGRIAETVEAGAY
jgi:hypothetical protein